MRVLELCAILVSFMARIIASGRPKATCIMSKHGVELLVAASWTGYRGEQPNRRDILLVSFHDMVTVPGKTARWNGTDNRRGWAQMIEEKETKKTEAKERMR